MAKIFSSIVGKGTVHGVTYYTLYGDYIARSKSSLTAKAVKGPRFINFMRMADYLGKASKIAKYVYRWTIPPEMKDRQLFYELLRQAKQLVIQEMDLMAIQDELTECWTKIVGEAEVMVEERRRNPRKKNQFFTVQQDKFSAMCTGMEHWRAGLYYECTDIV